MSDIDTLIAAFQTQLSDVMKTILKTVMYEVTKLVEDGLMEQLRSRNHEVESLKVQLQLAEKHLNDEYVVRKKEECDYNHGNSDLDELIEWHSDSAVAEGSGLKLGENCLGDSMGSFRQEVMTNVGETHTAEKLTPNISPKRDTQRLLFNKATEEDNDRPAVVVKVEADVKPSYSIEHQEGWSDEKSQKLDTTLQGGFECCWVIPDERSTQKQEESEPNLSAMSSQPPLSAAEKQRRYRARRDADEQRRQQYLQKAKEKWRKDVETGKKKRVKDLSELEKCTQRKRWKEAKKRSNARKDALKALNTAPIRPESSVSAQPGTSRSGLRLEVCPV